MSAAGTEGVGGNAKEISEYLGRENVEAVALPERLTPESSYAPLILDSASGTGKTQQAFALVKQHDNIIYFLMSEPPKAVGVTDQPVYKKMRKLTSDEGDFRFASRVDDAIEALHKNKKKNDEDICAVDFLLTKIDNAKSRSIYFNPEVKCWARMAGSDDKGLDLLVDVVLWMCSQRLQYNNNNNRLDPVPITLGANTSCNFQDLYLQLEDLILFVDEALPKVSTGGRPAAGAIDRLRFVRNLGRSLKMRVVLAGTAATAANMIAVKATSKPNEVSSRTAVAAGELAWIECQFLWKPMAVNDVKRVLWPNDASLSGLQESLISALAIGRPYLVHLFGRVMQKRLQFEGQPIDSGFLFAVLEEVGKELAIEKGMSDESNLVYLTAVWLHLKHISPCGMRLKPPDLVRGHYFEPCVVVDEDEIIACGLPWEERSLACGHLRVEVYCHRLSKPQKIMWNVSMTDTNKNRQTAFCWDFSGIEYALTACVQQCLAREPLLAMAISTQCGMNKANFREALSTIYQETPQQLNVDAADGELNEHMLFALLQLASNCKKLSEPRVDLDALLRKIAHYLTEEPDEAFANGVKELCDELKKCGKPTPSSERLDAILGTRNDTDTFKIDGQTSKCKTYTMPWLVPACTLEALKETIDKAPFLFKGDGIKNVAGLVPGVRNATFDAAAYSCKTLSDSKKDEVGLPEWLFEFKTRSKPGYNINRALDDLKTKCLSQQGKPVSEPDNQEGRLASEQPDEPESHEPKKKKQRVRDKPDKLKCHAMLIATTAGRATFCKIDYSDDSEEYFRVALVIGLGR